MGKSLNGKELGVGITQRKDGRYEGKFTNRFGKRETVYGKTLAEVRKNLDKAKSEDFKKENICDKNVRLDEWYNIWKSTYKCNVRNTTLEVYDRRYKFLKRYLIVQNPKLIDITQFHLQKIFNDMPTNGSRKNCKELLNQMFEKAVLNNLLVKNPIKNIILKKSKPNEKKERVCLSEEQAKAFLESAKLHSDKYNLYITALNTGMRVGEILCLTWDCVDFERKTIHVEKTLVEVDDGRILEVHEPKTATSNRYIPICQDVINALIDQKKISDPEKYKYVFLNRRKTFLRTHSINADILKCVKYNNESNDLKLPVFSSHTFRHTFATLCANKGMKIKTLQKIMGHAQYSITADIYYHGDDEIIRKEYNNIIGSNILMS